MTDVTVTCGCGRKMTQRGNNPKGTLTCGCGARIHVQVTEHLACMAMSAEGLRCDLPTVRESGQWELALCEDHFERFLAAVEAMRNAEQEHEAKREFREQLAREHSERHTRSAAENLAKAERYARQAQIYYVRIGDVIKIGTTVNMQMRMTALMPDEILATEPGDKDLEDVRHKQFVALKVRGERFRPEPELLSHIQMIREHYGEPKMTGYLPEY